MATPSVVYAEAQRRIGTSTRQVVTMTTWQALLVGAVGLLLGAGPGVATLAAVTKALTGSWSSYLPVRSTLGFTIGVAGLAAARIFAPTIALLRDET